MAILHETVWCVVPTLQHRLAPIEKLMVNINTKSTSVSNSITKQLEKTANLEKIDFYKIGRQLMEPFVLGFVASDGSQRGVPDGFNEAMIGYKVIDLNIGNIFEGWKFTAPVRGLDWYRHSLDEGRGHNHDKNACA
ncbi:uncharacterized protein LOC131941700 [Physella acuta]|uniref:uncharacterized protein LOC131941700 n=1 Tax=Physella acuta TaxID=109671 RepID=UPI0027DABC79|nr:uncharacterized protein LOC131941700 [Physella acuta]